MCTKRPLLRPLYFWYHRCHCSRQWWLMAPWMLHCSLHSNNSGTRMQYIESFAPCLSCCCCQRFGAIIVIERTRKNAVPLAIPGKYQTCIPHSFPFLSMEPPTVTRGQSTISLAALPLFCLFLSPFSPSPALVGDASNTCVLPSPQGHG